MITLSRRRFAASAVLVILLASVASNATTFQREVGIVDLLHDSQYILRGTVTKVSDGIDSRGIPYTEVTLHVTDAIRGQVSGDYTFRQFGLLKPRDMGNGTTNVTVTPAGWATYTRGEDTILFLHKPASWTGLQTTAGLGHGKFSVSMAAAVNQANNSGLFKNLKVAPGLLDSRGQRVMATEKGPVNVNAFIALLKQAVQNKWVEKGSIRNAQN